MTKRVLSLAAAVAVVLFLSAAFARADKVDAASTVIGTVSTTADGQITVTDKDGKDHALSVAKDAKITCDGSACALKDLKKGTAVTVTLAANDKTMAQQIDAKTK